MSPFSAWLDHFLVLIINSAGNLPPNHALHLNEVVILWPDGVDVGSFLGRVAVELRHKLGRARSAQGSWVEAVNIAACGDSSQIPASSQTKVSSSKTNKRLDFAWKGSSNIISAILLISGRSSLDDLSSNGHTHRVSNHIDLSSSSVFENSFEESSHLQHVLLSMVVLVGKVRISWTPGGCVKFCLGVSLSSQISSKFSETSLPWDVSVSASSSKAYITVSMDKNNRCFDDFLLSSGLASKSSALEVSPVEVPAWIAYIGESLPLALMKLAKSSVKPQVISRLLSAWG